jgi:four helix bundle protein
MISRQIRRASILYSNIAEVWENTDKEFIYFYMLKASAGEVRSQLYLAFDLNYNKEEFENS